MTLEESRIYRCGGFVHPSSIEPIVCKPTSVSPLSDSEVIRPELPKQNRPEDFNQLPIEVISVFKGVRRMDPLHRSDALGELANRGARLGEYLKDKGAESFVSHYKF